MRITSRKVRKYWDYMSKHYDTKILQKEDDLIEVIEAAKGKNVIQLVANLAKLNEGDEIGLVAMFLDRIDMVDVEKFMTRYTTTLADRIYVPFEIGDDSTHSLEAQIKICTHEHEHVLQYRDKPIEFIVRYLSDRAQRAIYEADAFRCNMEIERLLTGKAPRATGYANILKDYGCTDADIMVVEKMLRLSRQTIAAGGTITRAGQVGCRWLKKNL